MKGAAMLCAVALSGCAREGEAPPPPPAPAVLTLVPVGDEGATCRFSAEADGPALLAVSHRRNRASGQVNAEGEPVPLTGTLAVQGDALPGGVQLKGDGLTVAVRPADLPGVPVGLDGVRRAAVLTAATAEGASATLDGVWSCRAGG